MITIQRLVTVLTTVAFFTSLVSATALTYRFAPSEKACFFAQVDNQGTYSREPPGVFMRLTITVTRASFECRDVRVNSAG